MIQGGEAGLRTGGEEKRVERKVKVDESSKGVIALVTSCLGIIDSSSQIFVFCGFKTLEVDKPEEAKFYEGRQTSFDEP